MNKGNNMLSAKNIRIHGMSDPRWTKKDEMTQYKGLIKLYERDRKISDADTAVKARKQKIELEKLKNEIDKSRAKLSLMIIGDKQQLRNILAKHKDMQLAYENLPALLVKDHVYQNNFTKRKKLDLLKYEMKQRRQVLVDLKLRKALLEDRMKYPEDIFPAERKAEVITGKVQDAILKKEAAVVVHDAYVNIINIMKKDALYYDAILVAIKQDGRMQGTCMIRTTQLGQLAMEYLDDRKEEFKDLEKSVMRDMKDRLEDLNNVSKQFDELQDNMKHLIRKDSDINLGKVQLSGLLSNNDLTNEIAAIEEILMQLRLITLVENFKSIHPCFCEQARQKERLAEFSQRSLENRDNMLNKINHASVMKNLMENSMVETTQYYIEEKKRIANEIEEQKQRKRQIMKKMEVKNILLGKIKSSLKQLEALCSILDTTAKPKLFQRDQVMLPLGEPLYMQPFPDPGEMDGTVIIENITPKLQRLINAAPAVSKDYKEKEEPEAMMKYYAFVSSQQCDMLELQADQGDSLVEEVDVTNLVPTRYEIKKISAAIVKQYSVDPDLQPVEPKR